MNREYDKQFAYRSIRQTFKKIHVGNVSSSSLLPPLPTRRRLPPPRLPAEDINDVGNVPKSKSLPQPLPPRRRLPPPRLPAEDINDVSNVPKSKSLPQPLPTRRRLPPPRLPAEDINAEHTYDDVDSHYLHVSFKHDNQEPVEEYEYQECIAKVIYKNDYSYSSLWDKTPLTDVQRRNSKRLLPEVLTRLDHESVSTYLNCLKDGEERRNGIRLVIVGRQNTGKTSLTKRLLKESVENVQQTNGIQIHTLKCRGKVDEGNWIFHDGRTYDNEINSRLLKCCIAKSKANLSDDSNMATGYLSSKRPDESESEKSDNEFNACNLEEPDMSPTTFYQAHEVPVRDFYNLYDIVYAEIDAEDTAPIAIWDFAGDGEHSNTHQTFFGQESIYVVVSNVMDTIENDDPEYGLAFWLETIRCHCKSVDEEYYNDYQEPPVIIVGTHKDQFKGNNIDCKTQFQRQVHEIVRNSQIRRNIRKMYVISNTDDTDDEFDILRRDLVEIAKSRKQWNIKTPARWIHLEKALFENSYGKPVVAKSDIAEIANNIIQPITDEEELERFLTYHNGIGTYVYFSDLPEYVVLDPQWLESAFKCIITANQFQKDLVHLTEWKELRRDGRLSEKLLNEIFLHQEDYIKKYRAHLLKIMEKFNIIVRPRTMSDAYEINEESDYYVPCMIKKTSLSNIKEKFFNCPSKSSCLCVEFDFLPPSFATQILVACTRYYTVAKGPQTNDGRHPAFYRDFAIYNLDATGCEKLLIANYQNVLQIQIWKWGEPEKRSYHDVKAKILGIIEEMQQMRIQPSLSYELKLKCKYTDYECLDGMVDLKVIKPQKEYFCEEHGNTHNSKEIYFDWVGEIEQKIFSREQINATRMAIIILEILTSALYDLFISDFCGFSVKPRDECDITYLYAQLRRNNKHIPGHGWGCKWSDILNSHMLIGDDIERIRLARNVMAHLTKFSLDDNKYYELCGILAKVLYRLEIYNGKGKLYTDQMKNVKKQEIKLIDWQNYEKKITSEFPRLKMKPSFEVKVGFGCTLECEIIVPLPDGSKVYWIKEENSKEEELTVDETTSNKYKGSQSDYASLNIYCATKEDEGHYSCRIRYPEESAESMDENVKWPKTYLHVNNYVFEAKEDRKQKNKEHKPKRLMATLTSENAEIVGNDDVLIQFDGYDVQCLLDRRLSTTFYQTEGLGNNDVLVQCDGYNVHCLLDRRLSTPFNQTEKLGNKVDCKIVKEREELAGAIKMMKNGTLSENSVKIFNRCVRNGYSLCCRFLLKCNQSLYLKLCLMEAVKTSIHLSINASNSPEKAKHADTTKAIARQITRMFYNNQNEKQLFRNVYPAFKCVCENKNCTDFFCSNDLYIVVEVGNYISTLPINYEAFKIYQQYARDFPTEGMLISQEQKKSLLYRSCSVSLSHGVPLAFANQCFINYSNIVSIVPSFLRSKHFNSTRHKFTVEKCATITCSAKGFIPIGERHFPDSVKAADGTIVSTDVIEGNVTLANLLVGDHIESTVMSGTLGGVLLYYNRNCFITCAHVMLDEQSMISRKANQIHKKDLRVFVRDGNGKRIECGNTLRCDFETGSDTKPGIDVAIIEMNSQLKVDPNAMVKDQAKNLHSHLYLGMSNEYLNDNCIDYELLTLTNSHVEVMAFGQQTTIEKCKTVFEPEQVIEVELKSMGQAAAVANGNTTFPVMIAQPAHFQIFQGQFPGTRTFRMYNQLCLNVPLVSGDSGTCIYLRNCPYASANVKCNLSDTNGKCPHSGCLGMAIAFSNGMSIVTPLKKYLNTYCNMNLQISRMMYQYKCKMQDVKSHIKALQNYIKENLILEKHISSKYLIVEEHNLY